MVLVKTIWTISQNRKETAKISREGLKTENWVILIVSSETVLSILSGGFCCRVPFWLDFFIFSLMPQYLSSCFIACAEIVTET